VTVSTSVGVALSEADGERPERLLRRADLALYRAKSRGRACHALFDPEMEASVVERLELESALRLALDYQEFEVHYQPIFNLAAGSLVSWEALVRWQHPTRGLVSPDLFIPIAEETGLIVPLGQWVLHQACHQARAWQELTRDSSLSISVNISARQFQVPGLVTEVSRTLSQTRLHPRSLRLEITEGAVMQNPDGAIETLRALKELGIQLAVDDFGTGYSSLAYLKRFPVDTLKIDRSFVDGLGSDPQDSAIVRSVLALARTLELSVTAEGIETPAQRTQLSMLGCEFGQGYLFSGPLAADIAQEELLRVYQIEVEPAA
jgi:EAL domain-containing protein (putative c-di-GMP-specific phosphodiesterase class I)